MGQLPPVHRFRAWLFPDVHDFVHLVQAADVHRLDFGVHVIPRIFPGIVRIRGIPVQGVVQHHGPRLVPFRQIPEQGLSRCQGQTFHLQDLPVHRKAVAPVGHHGTDAMFGRKSRRIALEPARGQSYKMPLPLELIHTILGVFRHLPGDSQPQGPIDVKEKIFFSHRFLPLSVIALQ